MPCPIPVRGALLACWFLFSGSGSLAAQQLRADTVYPEFTVGPTGIRAAIENLEVVVKGAVAGSPAASAALQAGDVLLAVEVAATGQVRSFAGADPRVPLGEMIDLAEGADGQLAFEVRRGATIITRTLTLPVIGSHGPTWPLGDAKSDTIVNNLAAYIAASQQADHNYVFGGTNVNHKSLQGALAGLFLLSTDNPAYLEQIGNQARALATSAETRNNAGGHICWPLGYQGIFLAEYYLKTGDAQVLAGLEELCAWCTDLQMSGGWGHGAGGYGYVQGALMNHTGVPILIALTLAKECGVAVDDAGYNRAWKMFYRFAGHGTVPYGDHRIELGTSVNGRTGMFACALSLLDEPRYQAAAEQQGLMSADSYFSPESGHTGGGFNMIWRGIGSVHAPAAKQVNYQRHMDKLAWMYDLCRTHDGSFSLPATPPDNKRYEGPTYATGGLGLAYTAPRATLRITGAPPTAHSVTDGSDRVVVNLPDISWGAAADEVFFGTEHAAGYGAETEEPHQTWAKVNEGGASVAYYSQQLRHFHPSVRTHAALRLMNIKTSEAYAALAAAATDADPRVRRAAFDALSGFQGWGNPSPSLDPAVVSSTFLPMIVATLSNPDAAWWEIDGALYALGNAEPDDIRANLSLIEPFRVHSEWYLRVSAFWALRGLGDTITGPEFALLTDSFADSVHVMERTIMYGALEKLLKSNHSAFACGQRANSMRTLGSRFTDMGVPPGYGETGTHGAMHQTMILISHFEPEVYRYLVPDFVRYLQIWQPSEGDANNVMEGSPWQDGILPVLARYLGAYGKPVVNELRHILAGYDDFPNGTPEQKLLIEDAVEQWDALYNPADFPRLPDAVRLTAYYDFEGDFNDAPDAGDSADHLINDGATLSSDSPASTGSSQSASFDGNAALFSNTFSADLGPDPTGYTIMFWVKAADLDQETTDTRILSTRLRPGGGAASQPAWQVQGIGNNGLNGDAMSLRFNANACGAGEWVSPAATGAVANTGEAVAWHHVAYVVANSGHPSFSGEAYCRTFVDGVEVAIELQQPWTDILVGNTNGMLIIGGIGFAGLLDDVALFAGVVTDYDIAAIAAGEQSPADPLIGPPQNFTAAPALETPVGHAAFVDGALLGCTLRQDAANLFVVWAYADQGASNLQTWADADGAGWTAMGSYLPGLNPFHHRISGLEPDQQYWFRFFAENPIGESWSAVGMFHTNPEGDVIILPNGDFTDHALHRNDYKYSDGLNAGWTAINADNSGAGSWSVRAANTGTLHQDAGWGGGARAGQGFSYSGLPRIPSGLGWNLDLLIGGSGNGATKVELWAGIDDGIDNGSKTLVWTGNSNPPTDDLVVGNWDKLLDTGTLAAGRYHSLPLSQNLSHYNIMVLRITGNDSGVGTSYTGFALTRSQDPGPPDAVFTATPTTGFAPLEVAFTDLSGRYPTAWEWDFNNDGIVDSTERNPVHTYQTPGAYEVKLTVTNDLGSNATVATVTAFPINIPGLVLRWKLDEADGDFTAGGYAEEVRATTLSSEVPTGTSITEGQTGLAPDGGTSASFSDTASDSYIAGGSVENTGGVGTHVSGAATTPLVLGSNFTMCAWFNTDVVNNVDRVIFSNPFHTSTGFAFGTRGTNLFMDFGNTRHATATGPVTVGQTYFMAVMQDPDGDTNHGWAAGANNRIALYHPATETWRYFDNTQSKNGLILQNMSIGRFTNGGREFDGRLDDVRVYNQTLTQADLNKLVGGGGGYSNWAGSKLGGQGITDDFNGDGVENGIAYFMNDTGPITLPGVMGGAVTWTNGGHIQASAYGTEFVIETSPDLDLWTPVDVGDLDANTDGPGGSLTYPLPTGMGKIFVRLAVTPK